MDYKYLILLLCISGALAQSITQFPDQPVGVLSGESTVLVCGISNLEGYEVNWQKIDSDDSLPIYNSKKGLEDSTNYGIETPTGNVDYFNLVIKTASGGKDIAGTYSCSLAGDARQTEVLVFDPPVLGVQGEDTMPDALVAGVETKFTCTITYGAPTMRDLQDFAITVERDMGDTIDRLNGSYIYDQSSPPTNPFVYTANMNPTVLTYEDDGQESGCAISLGDFSANATQILNVYHKPDNITLDPSDPDNNYYKTETVMVVSSSNPAEKQHMYYRSSGTEWILVDNEEDAEDSFVIGNDWENPTSLRVQITNTFDHDGDGTPTDQVSNKTFVMNINACCRTDDGSHLTYSVLMTSLLALLTTLLLER